MRFLQNRGWPLKVVHLSQTDGGAGAGRAAYRIHRALLDIGVDSSMIVGDQRTADGTVFQASNGRLARTKARLCAYLEAKLARRLTRPDVGLFSPAGFGYFSPARDSRVRSADVVCLYWINGGFIRPEDLTEFSQPLVWRLSDVWPFSGGCHYPDKCEQFVERCGECPQLEKRDPDDRSRRLWERKAQSWRNLDLTVVAPSQWIAGLAVKSSLFRDQRIEVIATGVDTALFRPRDRMMTRAGLGLPRDRKIIVYGAAGATTDKRKGWNEFVRAITLVTQQGRGQDWHIAVFGADAVPALPLPVTVLGTISDEDQLAQLFACADVVVVPSIEDNLPQVALEALASGAPVIAFRIGGLPDAIIHRENGWLAKLGDISGFAEGLIWAMSAGDGPRVAARRHAETHFSQPVQIARYAALLSELSDARRNFRS